MSSRFSAWHVDGDTALKRSVRIETIGKTFALYEQQWRSEAYYFGDLVYRGLEDDVHIFGLEDGIKARPKWKLGIDGELPPELSDQFPEHKRSLLSPTGMIVIAVICLAIVYMVGT